MAYALPASEFRDGHWVDAFMQQGCCEAMPTAVGRQRSNLRAPRRPSPHHETMIARLVPEDVRTAVGLRIKGFYVLRSAPSPAGYAGFTARGCPVGDATWRYGISLMWSGKHEVAHVMGTGWERHLAATQRGRDGRHTQLSSRRRVEGGDIS
jgi:hypothetical protein